MPDDARIALTIARQLGAGGAILGQRLAQRLGFTYLDREILRLAAERLGAAGADLSRWDERIERFWDRMLNALSIGPPDGVYTAVPGPPAMDNRRLFELESQIIREMAARQSVVVIGRGGSWVLRDHPALVRIYLHAPVSARVPTVMQAYRLGSEQAAREMIGRVDADRDRFTQEIAGRMANDARCHDLSINTGCVGMDLAEEMAVRLVEHVRGEPCGGRA